MSEPLIRRINREEMLWRGVEVERLIEEDHAARAIWDLVGGLDLRAFYQDIKCSAEEGGRRIRESVLRGSPHPQLLQRMAVVYIRGKEYRVSAPPEAKCDALDWFKHWAFRESADIFR